MSHQKQIAALIESHDDDRELATALLEYGRANWQFSGQVGRWGPLLYERNRKVFLPLIERHVSVWGLRDADDLHGWMEAAERNGDVRLFRTLFQAWLNDSFGWNGAANKWREMLLDGFSSAADRAARRAVVDKYDIWYEIEDDFAAQLYAIDPVVTSDFLTRRLDRSVWIDEPYDKTAELARQAGDDDFYFYLYRRTFPTDRWQRDVLQLADDVQDPLELRRELTRRHPDTVDGPGGDPETFAKLLISRELDVLPYLERQVGDVVSWSQDWQSFARAAFERGFFNLWSIIVRTQFRDDWFKTEVKRLLDSDLDEWEKLVRLNQIAGAEWGWAEWRRPIVLAEDVAIELFDVFPALVAGPFSVHLGVSTHAPYLDLARRAAETQNEAVVDILAARAAVAHPGWYRSNNLENFDWYAEHYRSMDDESFPRRAFDVLGRLEDPGHNGRQRTRRDNPVFKVFVDDVDRYLPRLDRVRDLLEAPSEVARHVGVRLLLADAEAGSEHAAQNADHLAAYLLNEARRATRIDALGALALAAHHSPVVAADVLSRARQTLDLRRKAYPRDRLIELIGRILHRWPELRGPRESPVVFGAPEPSRSPQEAAW